MLLAETGQNIEVGVAGVIAAIGTVLLPQIFNGVRAILADRAKAFRDNEQTELFRKMHEEQINTRVALVTSTVKSDERFTAIKDSRDAQHREIMSAIGGSCKYKPNNNGVSI